jgi:4-hydroxybenzoate polyprenyltransferase
MKLSTALRLGRVSNLPTTWTNVLAGLALASTSGALDAGLVLALCAIVSCMYVGGMFLNDAFDREYDARERPERPIPSGEVSARSVFTIGFALLATGVAGTAALALLRSSGTGWPPVLAALALAGCIVFYDAHHKQNPLSPVLMAGNRVLVYALAALSVAPLLASEVYWGAGALGCYLIGLTYAAKQENLRALRGVWPLVLLAVPFAYAPALRTVSGMLLYAALAGSTVHSVRLLLVPAKRDIRRAVTQLIAGISLLDGMLVGSQGHHGLAGVCVLGWLLTLRLQRVVAGT